MQRHPADRGGRDFADQQFTLQFDTSHPGYASALSVSALGISAYPTGLYGVVSMMFINQSLEDNIYNYLLASPAIIQEHKAATLKGGCCSILAIAHSLVRKMGGIVRKTTAGQDGKKGDTWGHRTPVQSVSFTENPCCCTITTIATSVQESDGATDFEGIPYDPGTEEYKVCVDAQGNTTVTNNTWPSSIITYLAFDSFDEEPRNGNVKSTDQGEEGSALDC